MAKLNRTPPPPPVVVVVSKRWADDAVKRSYSIGEHDGRAIGAATFAFVLIAWGLWWLWEWRSESKAAEKERREYEAARGVTWNASRYEADPGASD